MTHVPVTKQLPHIFKCLMESTYLSRLPCSFLPSVFRERGKPVKTDAFRFCETITATKYTVATHHNARFCPPRGVTCTLKNTHLPAAPQV